MPAASADQFDSDLPPEYVPNLPDSAVRILSQQHILNQLNEIEQNLLVRHKGAPEMSAYFDLEDYERISILYKGMVVAELTLREHEYQPREHSFFGTFCSINTDGDSGHVSR